MSTDTKELNTLIEKARAKGVTVLVEWNAKAEILEDRLVYEKIAVRGLPGCGPGWMNPITAAERLRELV